MSIHVGLKVSEIMTKKVRSIDSNMTGYDALGLMVKHKIDSVVVTSNGTPVGVVTETDFIREFAKERENNVVLGREDPLPTQITVHRLISGPLVRIQSDASIEHAQSLMRKHNVTRLPVFAGDRLVGMVTNRELANLCSRLLTERETSDNGAKKDSKFLRPRRETYPIVAALSMMGLLATLWTSFPVSPIALWAPVSSILLPPVFSVFIAGLPQASGGPLMFILVGIYYYFLASIISFSYVKFFKNGSLHRSVTLRLKWAYQTTTS